MNFVYIFVYIMAYTGLAYILGHSFITKGPRARMWEFGPKHETFPLGHDPSDPRGFWQWLVTLIECPACFGTWFGFVFGFVFPQLDLSRWQSSVLVSLFTAGVGVVVGRLTGMLEIR